MVCVGGCEGVMMEMVRCEGRMAGRRRVRFGRLVRV